MWQRKAYSYSAGGWVGAGAGSAVAPRQPSPHCTPSDRPQPLPYCAPSLPAPPADVWALGCVLHELCTLRPAFLSPQDRTEQDIKRRVRCAVPRCDALLCAALCMHSAPSAGACGQGQGRRTARHGPHQAAACRHAPCPARAPRAQVLEGRVPPIHTRYSLDLRNLVDAMLRPDPKEVRASARCAGASQRPRRREVGYPASPAARAATALPACLPALRPAQRPTIDEIMHRPEVRCGAAAFPPCPACRFSLAGLAPAHHLSSAHSLTDPAAHPPPIPTAPHRTPQVRSKFPYLPLELQRLAEAQQGASEGTKLHRGAQVRVRAAGRTRQGG